MKRLWIVALSGVFLAAVLWATQINGYFDFDKLTAPGNPAAGFGRLFIDSSTNLIGCLNSDGSSCAPSSPTTNQNFRSVGVTIDGGGTALSGTTTRCAQVNYAGTINEFSMVSDVSGNATVQVDTVPFGSYTGPGSATDISAGGEVMTGATRKQDTTLTGWTTAVTANTVFCFVLSSPSTVTWVSANVRIAAN